MDILQTVIMGIVQGLSEFLPISSSAHLVLTSNLYYYISNFNFLGESHQEVFLDIMLHLGTLIAVLIFFRKELLKICKAVFSFDRENPDFKTGMYIVLGTIITVIVALPLSPVAERLVFKPLVVGVLLIFTGIFLVSSEYYNKKHHDKKDINLKNSIIIAIAQGLAALPGFSRSGLTIAAALFSNIDRAKAARYSFLLSIPTILGASMVYPLLKLDLHEVVAYNWNAIMAGTVVSAITGYLCIKYFLKFVSKFSLAIFGYYCLIVGILAVLFFMGE